MDLFNHGTQIINKFQIEKEWPLNLELRARPEPPVIKQPDISPARLQVGAQVQPIPHITGVGLRNDDGIRRAG